MDTEQLENQFQLWNRFMYIVLGSAITFVVISFGNFLNPRGWTSFANYAAGPWMMLELLATPPGFYLLWHKPWQTLPLQRRINTISGYLIASWLGLVAFGLMIQTDSPTELGFLVACGAILFPLLYIWILKRKPSQREEMFP